MYPSRTFDNKHKHLIISVDDLGSDQSIDQVIYELLLNDRISNLSVIVNGSSFQNAAEKMEELKNKQKNKYLNCSIGLHFNLTEGKPLSDKIKQGKLTKNGEFLGKQKFYTEIINCEEICRDQISQQFRTQLRQFIKYFKRRPSHVDGHQNVHLVPKIAAILSDLMSESGIYRTQILELSMYRQEKELRQLFETYSIQSKNIYLKKNIAFASCFVRLSETNNLSLENIQKAFQSQNLETINYKAVEAMYHPHSYAKQLEHQSNNSDSNSFIKEKDYLQSQHFLQIIKQFNGLSSYLDLRGKSSPQTPKLLIFSKMDVGTGNHTTTQRLKQIFQAIGYQVYLWSAVDQLNSDVEIADLQRFLMNFQISLIIGVNVTRTGQIIYEATHSKKPIRMDIPYFLVIAGTDANLSFGNQMQLKQLKNSLERSSCIISISEDMTAITKNVLQSLKIQKNIYTVTQSSCISQYLSYPTQSPSNYCPLNAKPFILFPTSFREVKCVHHLFKQLNQIIATNDIDVIIVGPILNQKYYEQCRYKLGAIKYLGVIKKQLYVRYLKEARLVINTSQSEGMSCSILQAFQVNVPVLARRNAGNQELIQHYDNGLLYDTPQHFLQLFNELNQNQSLRQKLVQNSSKLFKSKYSLQQQIASYQQIAKHQYQNKMYWMCNKTSFINVYNHESVHPTSEVNNSLFLQTKPIIADGSYILDLGCGTGIFSLILLSRCAAKSIHLHLTDIDPEITGNALYNYRHSSIWQSIQSITCTESDMFTNIDKNIKFDVIIFNPPQTPFQHSESRPDKNGGIDAMKYYEPALKYFAESGGKQLFFLHSSMAWPVRFKQLLSKYKLKVQWTSTKGIHKIRAADYDLMEENLANYILEHKAKGMADIQLVGQDFIVPAQIFNIVPQSQ